MRAHRKTATSLFRCWHSTKKATLKTSNYDQYVTAISSFSGDPCASSLLMAEDGAVSVYYAPFEWVNQRAKVVLVGITPGKTQAANALAEAQRALRDGASADEVLRRARATGAFSGAMRPNLVSLLDEVGLQHWLGLKTCNELFQSQSHLLQTASVLQYPVFLSGANYNGTPDPINHPLLQTMVIEHFATLCRQLSAAVFVPLGPVPTKTLAWLAARGVVSPTRILSGLPHPSGANAERIKYFLGQKNKADLSKKTDPDKLDLAKASLIHAISTL